MTALYLCHTLKIDQTECLAPLLQEQNLILRNLILNTSFNENEPIVCTPTEALECFLRTNMDVLILGDFVIK